MESASRHQCLLYAGAPSRHLPALAEVTRRKLNDRYRCLYLNSSPMVAGMRSYLAAAGVDVEGELISGNLILSCDQSHLIDREFEAARMLGMLEEALQAALREGYAGLFASGDMTFELGPDKDFTKLVQYELKLEELFLKHAELSGICQYHADTMPREALRQGVMAHRSLFVNETLSLVNPHYIREAFSAERSSAPNPELDAFMLSMIPEAPAP